MPGQTYISDFSFWSVGSNSIGVQFNKSGTYTVRRLIGLTSSNDPLCTIDSVDHIICVDTVPLASLLLSLPDTSCIGNTLNTSMNLDSVNCSEASKYQFSVYDSTYTSLIYQSSNSTNYSILRFFCMGGLTTVFSFMKLSGLSFEVRGLGSDVSGMGFEV